MPSDHVGDITGDLAQRRGRPTGQEMLPGDLTIITAQVRSVIAARSAAWRSRSGLRWVLWWDCAACWAFARVSDADRISCSATPA